MKRIFQTLLPLLLLALVPLLSGCDVFDPSKANAALATLEQQRTNLQAGLTAATQASAQAEAVAAAATAKATQVKLDADAAVATARIQVAAATQPVDVDTANAQLSAATAAQDAAAKAM